MSDYLNEMGDCDDHYARMRLDDGKPMFPFLYQSKYGIYRDSKVVEENKYIKSLNKIEELREEKENGKHCVNGREDTK